MQVQVLPPGTAVTIKLITIPTIVKVVDEGVVVVVVAVAEIETTKQVVNLLIVYVVFGVVLSCLDFMMCF
jgi:hypothetical protein